RLDLITVTGVSVSPDVMQANVYVTAHGDDERYREVLQGLESAKGRIRALLGKRMTARFTPELRFFIDESVDAGQRMNEALKEIPPTMRDDFGQ
ncbi:30S ribosome-binding factor RbfA, partial [bacterium]|nr:30S ribosome-binding factor RbfA [bacterium]